MASCEWELVSFKRSLVSSRDFQLTEVTKDSIPDRLLSDLYGKAYLLSGARFHKTFHSLAPVLIHCGQLNSIVRRILLRIGFPMRGLTIFTPRSLPSITQSKCTLNLFQLCGKVKRFSVLPCYPRFVASLYSSAWHDCDGRTTHTMVRNKLIFENGSRSCGS